MSPRVFKFAKFLLIIGLLAVFFALVPFRQIYIAVRAIDPRLFWVSVLLGIPVIYLDTVSMWLLAHKQGITISISHLFVYNLVIRFYGYFSPASMLSTGMRWYKLSEGGKTAQALSVIAVHRAIDIFVAVCFGLFWAITSIGRVNISPMSLAVFLIVMLVGWLGVTRISATAAAWINNKSLLVQVNFLQRLRVFFTRLMDSIMIYSHLTAIEYFKLIGVNILSEIIGLIAFVFLAFTLKIPISLFDLGWMRAIFFLVALTPFTLAGGFGIREVSVVVVMSAFGIQPDLAAALSLLLYARGVILSLFGGMIELISMFSIQGKA